eukprot:UC4_evm9s776
MSINRARGRGLGSIQLHSCAFSFSIENFRSITCQSSFMERGGIGPLPSGGFMTIPGSTRPAGRSKSASFRRGNGPAISGRRHLHQQQHHQNYHHHHQNRHNRHFHCQDQGQFLHDEARPSGDQAVSSQDLANWAALHSSPSDSTAFPSRPSSREGSRGRNSSSKSRPSRQQNFSLSSGDTSLVAAAALSTTAVSRRRSRSGTSDPDTLQKQDSIIPFSSVSHSEQVSQSIIDQLRPSPDATVVETVTNKSRFIGGLSGMDTNNILDAKTFAMYYAGDRIYFAESASQPGVPVIQRHLEDRIAQPDRLNLDRRNLSVCPILEKEERLRLLNYQHNNIQHMKNMSQLTNLVFLDLYDNKIQKIDGLGGLQSLRVLMLGKNRIRCISDLEPTPRLDVLDLHGNLIEEIKNLSHLGELRVLNLGNNNLTKVDNLEGCIALAELNLRHNKITSVDSLQRLQDLERLYLSFNQILSFDAISCVNHLTCLLELTLDHNPFSKEQYYREYCISAVQSLKALDGKRISEEDRRMSGIIIRKEEGKRKDQMKAAKAREVRETIIARVEARWMGEIPPSTLGDKDGEEIPCSYAEIVNGDSIVIYGDGLEAIERTWVSGVTRAIFKYVHFNSLIPYFGKMRSRFANIIKLDIFHTDICFLRHIDHICGFKKLEHININPDKFKDGKRVWKFYLIWKLSHLPLNFINDKPISAEEKIVANKLFGMLPHITDEIPAYRQHIININDGANATQSGSFGTEVTKSKKSLGSLQRRRSLDHIDSRKDSNWDPNSIARSSFPTTFTADIVDYALNVKYGFDYFEKIWPQVLKNLAVKAYAQRPAEGRGNVSIFHKTFTNTTNNSKTEENQNREN